MFYLVTGWPKHGRAYLKRINNNLINLRNSLVKRIIGRRCGNIWNVFNCLVYHILVSWYMFYFKISLLFLWLSPDCISWSIIVTAKHFQHVLCCCCQTDTKRFIYGGSQIANRLFSGVHLMVTLLTFALCVSPTGFVNIHEM